jgi:hypothetical protein
MALLTRVPSKSGFDTVANLQNVPGPGVSGEAFDICQSLEQRVDGKFYKFTGTRPYAGSANCPSYGADQNIGVARAGARFDVGAVVVPGNAYFAAAAGEIDSAATAGDTRGAFIGRVHLDAAGNIVAYALEIVNVGKLT